MGLVSWIIVGLIAGALARLLMPGKVPMKLWQTVLLGMGGSVVAGFIFKRDTDYSDMGIVWSTIGAIIVLVVYRWIQRRQTQ
ncbi:MAG: GlsB/YeaQ/YmgE family stress response membrane protein [Acidimicrobiia bacterium]|nr:GlsB/YeaQ/YmgE family stress response membrane protein [Acidimicrobiia bacterium]